MLDKKSTNLLKLYNNKIWRPRLLAVISKVLRYVNIKEYKVVEIFDSFNKLRGGSKSTPQKIPTDKHIINALRSLNKVTVEPYNEKANISRAFRKWKLIKPHLTKRVNGVLDFGGNIGDAAYVFGRMITKNSKEQTFVVDIDEWAGETWTPRDDITFVHFDKMQTLIDSNKKVDLITVSHVLHHINSEYYASIMELFDSMLTRGGTIVLYEHDCTHDNWATLIDLEHCLFDVVASQKLTFDKFVKGFYAKYISAKKWEKLFETHFELKHVQYMNNVDNSFYAFYTKK